MFHLRSKKNSRCRCGIGRPDNFRLRFNFLARGGINHLVAFVSGGMTVHKREIADPAVTCDKAAGITARLAEVGGGLKRTYFGFTGQQIFEKEHRCGTDRNLLLDAPRLAKAVRLADIPFRPPSWENWR